VLASSVVNVIYAVALNDGFVPAALGFLIYQGVRYACIIPMLIWPNVAVQRAGLVVLLAHTVLMMF